MYEPENHCFRQVENVIILLVPMILECQLGDEILVAAD